MSDIAPNIIPPFTVILSAGLHARECIHCLSRYVHTCSARHAHTNMSTNVHVHYIVYIISMHSSVVAMDSHTNTFTLNSHVPSIYYETTKLNIRTTSYTLKHAHTPSPPTSYTRDTTILIYELSSNLLSGQ